VKKERLTKTDLYIIQKEEGFKINLDSVLISSFADLSKTNNVADLGCGTGGILFLLKHRKKSLILTGFEQNKDFFDALKEGVKINDMENNVNVYDYDIRSIPEEFYNSFDMVISNPPYFKKGNGRISNNSMQAEARTELNGGIDDFCDAAYRLLKDKGRFVFIHSSNRMPEIFNSLYKHHLTPKKIRFVHPYISNKSNVFMAECSKKGGFFTKIEPPLIVYKEKKIYTEEVLDFYRKVYDS